MTAPAPDGFPYELAFSSADSSYEWYMEQLGGPDANGRLLLALLGGGGCLIDVGANIGTLSIPVARSGSRVIAVEMLPSNTLKLWTAMRLNRLSNLAVIQAAASDSDGILTYSGEEAWGTVSPAGTPAMSLKIDSMLECFGGLPTPFVIKIDVEGHEPHVINGARQTIRKLRPAILFENIEIEGRPRREPCSKQMLAELGYDLYMVRNEVLSPTTPRDLQEGWVVDFLALPLEKQPPPSIAHRIRSLTDSERLEWVAEMVRFPGEAHQRHAAGVLLRWKSVKPGLAEAAAALKSELLGAAHLEDLHPMLREL